MSLINLIELQNIGDARGSLVSLEGNVNVPFEIKRVYYIFGTLNGVSRGFHAHKKLKQLVVCVSGSCRFELDFGPVRESVLLDCPTKALFISDMVWREMHDFSDDCVLMVLADDHYSEDDYIRDYDEFIASKEF